MKSIYIFLATALLLTGCSTTSPDLEKYKKNDQYDATRHYLYDEILKNDPRTPLDCRKQINAFLDLKKYNNPKTKDLIVNAYLCTYTYDPIATHITPKASDSFPSSREEFLELIHQYYNKEFSTSLNAFHQDVIDPINKSLKNLKAPSYNKAIVLFNNAAQYAYKKNYPEPFVIYLQRQEKEAKRVYGWMVK